jgi:hypothetical protein
VTRLELARAEIARRRALAEAATAGGWVAVRPPKMGAAAADLWSLAPYVCIASSGGYPIRRADAGHIAANDPAHVLRVLAAADATLDRHARTHVCQGRWLDDPEAAGDDSTGRYVWPHLVCADAQAVLDLYAPQETTR